MIESMRVCKLGIALRIELRERRSKRKLRGIKGGKRKRDRIPYAFRLTYKRSDGATGSGSFRSPIEALRFCERYGIEFGAIEGDHYYSEYNNGEIFPARSNQYRGSKAEREALDRWKRERGKHATG